MRKERQSKLAQLVIVMTILLAQTMGISISSHQREDMANQMHCRVPLRKINIFDDNFYSVLATHQDFLMSPFTRFVETREDDSIGNDDMLKNYRTTQVPAS
jgi:hypothetical protein